MTMLDYIAEQPKLLKETLENREVVSAPFCGLFAKEDPDHIYLIASGTSHNGAAAAAPFMEMVLDRPVSVVPPSRVSTLRGKKPLAVFVSQGGNSTNTIAAIEQLRGVPSLAMTGDPDGRINTMCDAYMEIPCGEETAGPKTKGYTVTILTLYVMALEAAKQCGSVTAAAYDEYVNTLGQMASACGENVTRTKDWVQRNIETLKTMKVIYTTGKRQGMQIAEESALKLMETILIPGSTFEFEEYLHGPACSIGTGVSGLYLLPVSTDPDYERMQRLVAYHRELCDSVYTVGLPASEDVRDCVLLTTGAWYTQPFEQILPMQVASAVLPLMLGLETEGHRRFVLLDGALHTKYKDPEANA